MQGLRGKFWQINVFGEAPVLVEKDYSEDLLGDEVVVRVEAAPINPSDMLYLTGNYVRKPLPAGCGFEGVGRVVRAGAQALHVLDKRVCFMGQEGSWSQLVKMKVFGCIPIDPEVNLASAACGQVNPLTVRGFLDIYAKGGFKGIVHTAAASQVGRMLVKSCAKKGINLINVVRRKELAHQIQKLGAKHIIDSSEEGWQQRLQKLAAELHTNCCFDCVGGNFTGKLLSLLPPQSTLYLYGNLSFSRDITVHLPDLFAQKALDSFNLPIWLQSLSGKERAAIYKEHSECLQNELKSQLQTTFSLQELPKAIQHYKKQTRSHGKILLIAKQ